MRIVIVYYIISGNYCVLERVKSHSKFGMSGCVVQKLWSPSEIHYRGVEVHVLGPLVIHSVLLNRTLIQRFPYYGGFPSLVMVQLILRKRYQVIDNDASLDENERTRRKQVRMVWL